MLHCTALHTRDVARLSKSVKVERHPKCFYHSILQRRPFYKNNDTKTGKFQCGILWSCTGIDQSESLLCTCYFLILAVLHCKSCIACIYSGMSISVQIYRVHNIRITLVLVETWSSGDRITVTTDSGATLENAITYKNTVLDTNNATKDHDNVQFLS